MELGRNGIEALLKEVSLIRCWRTFSSTMCDAWCDAWMDRNYPTIPFGRYADDAVCHCKTERQAKQLLEGLKQRFTECGLELHPEKTKIVYCMDDDRRGNYPNHSFDFLGYTFRPRRSRSRYGKFFVNFTPAVSNEASQKMRRKVREWKLHLRSDKTLEDLANMLNPVVRGWVNYFKHFYKSAMYPVLRYLDEVLVRRVMRKYRKLRGRRRMAWEDSQETSNTFCTLDIHNGWTIGAG